jgi:predicted phage-related endonuclease
MPYDCSDISWKNKYFENNFWINDKIPFAHASLDGWITEIATGAKGILEIKTVNIYNNNDLAWKDRIPDYYYTQILHYMMITEFDFAILKARIKYSEDYIVVKTYRIDRLNVLEDIKLLAEKEKDFYKSLQGDVVPNLILPNI